MLALASGEISDAARGAIVRDVATLILNYCKYPTTQQLEVVASKITKQFPVLADTWYRSCKLKHITFTGIINHTVLKFRGTSLLSWFDSNLRKLVNKNYFINVQV